MADQPSVDIQFLQLVLSLQAAAMQQMGKVTNPMTGQVERDLTLAKQSVDMVEMLERKTRGNLTPDEKRIIDHVLYELRMNFVDELAKESRQNDTQTDTNPPSNLSDN